MADIPPDAPAPRLCRIIKRPNFEGFGFNLHAGKNKQGQFIGKVDPGSPAEEAGLKSGDRIIEVNGVNIGNENHKQVMSQLRPKSLSTCPLYFPLPKSTRESCSDFLSVIVPNTRRPTPGTSPLSTFCLPLFSCYYLVSRKWFRWGWLGGAVDRLTAVAVHKNDPRR